MLSLTDVPELFQCAAELDCVSKDVILARRISSAYLAAGHTGTQRVFTDTNLFVDIRICEIITSAGHSTHENGDVVRRRQGRQVFRQALCGSVA